ncbi:DUF3265 domain-containing protein [Vibrio coralliilyticus]|nr:DUF3265 domain-containing protein [Vibrio coralliilyticus]
MNLTICLRVIRNAWRCVIVFKVFRGNFGIALLTP